LNSWLEITGGMETLVTARKQTVFVNKIIGDEDCDDEYKFAGDEIRNNNGKIIRLFYNNCNGIEINLLIKSQIQLKVNKTNEKYLG